MFPLESKVTALVYFSGHDKNVGHLFSLWSLKGNYIDGFGIREEGFTLNYISFWSDK